MRTLIQVVLRDEGERELTEESVRAWFAAAGFRPALISLSHETKLSLVLNDESTPVFTSGSEPLVEVVNRHAADILLAIPLSDQERYHALNTAKYVIHYDDAVHGTTVWGLLGIDLPNVTVRWRQRVSKSLERATEELVAKVWQNSGPGNLFEPFSPGHNVPVREPRSTTDAYVGEILPPGPRLKQRARADKSAELKTALWVSIATGACFVTGLLLFLVSSPDSGLRWVSGAFDRLATTGAATAVVSYLSYLFHLRELQRKPIIDWK
ncbi:MAG: hypothetical protein ABW277_19160 [Longimicrobiaceae bacterium]